jgi:hypothetical protein
MKSVGLFNYDKLLAENGIPVNCEVRVFPLLVKRQSEAWPEFEQRRIQWVEPARAVALIKEPGLKKLVAAFAKKIAVAASKTVQSLTAAVSLNGPRHRPRRSGSTSGRRSLRAPDRRRRPQGGH